MLCLEPLHFWVELVKTQSQLLVCQLSGLLMLVPMTTRLLSPKQLNVPQCLLVVVLTASTSAPFLRGYVEAGVGNDTIKVTGKGVTSASLKAGVGDDLMSITGGITDGSLFGGTGNDSFNFFGGRATGVC